MGGEELQTSVLTWMGCIVHNNYGVWGHAPPEFCFFNRWSEIDSETFREYVVSSKREVYTARLSFIWFVKDRKGEGGINWS